MFLKELLYPLSWAGVGTAVLCGGVIGLERQLRGKTAGMRTSILVCLGTQVFVELGASLGGGASDPARVLGQVVTGIGFLGAGVILSRGGVLTGVTSAAVVWILAAIGAASGLGHYGASMALAAVTIGVLLGVEAAENSFRRLREGVHARFGDGSEGEDS